MEPDSVVDERAGAHGDRLRGKNLEAELRRGNAPEVSGVGEEGEDLVPRERDGQAAGQAVFGEMWHLPPTPRTPSGVRPCYLAAAWGGALSLFQVSNCVSQVPFTFFQATRYLP